MAQHPTVTQGTLNRLRASIVVPSYSNLNASSSNMGKNFTTVEFDGDFALLLETATGAISSPEPYVMANVTVDLLRTQAVSGAWLAQGQTQSEIGNVQIHPDTTAFPVITINDTIIRNVHPGEYDGQNPVVRLDLRGVFYLNNNLWLSA